MERVTDPGRLSRIIHCIYEESDFSLFNKPFNVEEYAKKLIDKGINIIFVEDGKDAGLVSFYANDSNTHIGYIAIIGVLADYKGKGLAQTLMDVCLSQCVDAGMEQVKLEVAKDNSRAIAFYEHYDFSYLQDATGYSMVMIKKLHETRASEQG